MEELTVVELIREYGKEMDMAGRYTALRSSAAAASRTKAARLLAEIVRRIPTQ
ncbi:hypothetical protein [Micromonospora sp. NPDC005299]|uniref:hypothetical protein n=1 Tax=Micromonospora sp. NPDC005299 TaxID=3364231 RepID=UPI0036CC7BA7